MRAIDPQFNRSRVGDCFHRHALYTDVHEAVRIVCAILFVVLVLTASTATRTDTLTGQVSGTVLDGQNRLALNGATVILLNLANGRAREARTTANGEYIVFQVEPGAYSVRAEREGYASIERPRVLVPLNQPKFVIPVFLLQRIAGVRPVIQLAANIVPPSPITFPRPRVGAGPTQAPAPTVQPGETSLVSLQDWALRFNFDASITEALPLRGGRSFDQLALFAPGVARPPFSEGVGPATGIGVGSVGQFTVNGLRSRSNNFTVDGSDNNDEDINVRRQGFVALVPQSAESVSELQIMTAGFPAEFGRNSGSMVNAISLSGQSDIHGAVYGLFNDDALNAGNVFDSTFVDAVNSAALSGGRYLGKNSTNSQYGAVVGGRLAEKRAFYFLSGERQIAHGTRLHHFVVPTKDERGLRVNGGFVPVEDLQEFFDERDIPYSNAVGLGVFSLYPLPNNVAGPFGVHNYSQAQSFSTESNAFSTKFDWHESPVHAFAARYNFTQDRSHIPFTGDSINSAVEAATRIQNLSLFGNSTTSFWGNAFRFSYGRSRLSFPPDAGSSLLFGSSPAGTPAEFVRTVQTTFGRFGPFGATGPIGQLSLLPYSTIGVDVYNFPQGRVDNTFQLSDFVTSVRNRHITKAGFDIRHSQLNSFAARNDRPLVVFGYGTVSPTCQANPFCTFSSGDGVLRGTDLASLGAPSGFLQALTTDSSENTAIGLRMTQYDFFIQDDWRVRPRLTVNLGLRYERQSVPQEVHHRIESTFGLTADQFGHLTPVGTVENQRIIRAGNLAFDQALNGLQQFIGDRTRIYSPDRNNFGPRAGFAWDPRGNGKTAIHAGFCIQFDANPGAFTSQSRNVFPTFVPINLDLNFRKPDGRFINNPTFFTFLPTQTPLVKPGTLNVYNLTGDAFATGLGTLFNQQPANPSGTLAGNGLAFTLPEKDMKTAYAEHVVVSAEQQFGDTWLVSGAYVATRGRRLARFRTPNGGLISEPFLASSFTDPLAIGDTPPLGGRPGASLGAFTVMENSASSSYDAMQLSGMRRATNLEFRANWTWSHAIDDVSDMFDLRGAFALPEDSAHPEKERASANFDVRHRLTGFVIWNGIRNWTAAVTQEIETGQPYTINTVVDTNGDGNLTDRPFGLGRNTARAPAIHTTDIAVTRRIALRRGKSLDARIEVFNLFNEANLAIPVRLIESPGFGKSFDTHVDSRSIRFAAKLSF
jgi:hypothetical protein